MLRMSEEQLLRHKKRVGKVVTAKTPAKRAKSLPVASKRPTRGLPKAKSAPEELLAAQMTAAGIQFEREVRFYPGRKWRFDFLLRGASGLALEVQGWGRHQRRMGFEADCEKLTHAAMVGYRVILVTPSQVKSGKAIQWIKQALVV